MNDWIKELADEAGVSITAANKNGVFTLLPDNQKKFAELIVKECCQKLENDGMVEVAMEMKEHFGVEE